MDNLEMQILDEAISFLNTGKMTLDHRNNFINTYTKISHIPVNNKTGFYLFHNDILKKMQELLKPYNLTCKLFGVYNNKNALQETKIATILIEKGKDKDEYNTNVVKLMDKYKGSKLIPILNDLKKDKVEVTDVNYCYTVAYQVYSIDVTYVKKQ